MKTSIIIITLFIITASVSYSQWLPDVRLTNDPAYSGTSQNPSARCMVTNGDTVNIVWNDSRNGASYEIYYKRSTDGGIYWGSDTRISNNIYMSKDPAISVSGSVVHVVWNDLRDGNYEIYYNRSTDGGSSWGTEIRLTDYPAVSERPSISVSGSVVHVAWQDFRNAFSVNVYYKRSTDSGLSWSADTQLTNDTASGNPTISASGSGVKLVFLRTQHSGYDYGIFYKASTDGGLNWGTEITLLNDSVNKANPILSVTGSSVFVTWLDPRYRYPNYEICYKHSTDGGITWGIDTRLTTNRTSATAFYNISVSGSG
ncbi:MAG: hypothetical protein ABI543_05620, partial [Ignavibacteria bacterium]